MQIFASQYSSQLTNVEKHVTLSPSSFFISYDSPDSLDTLDNQWLSVIKGKYDDPGRPLKMSVIHRSGEPIDNFDDPNQPQGF